MTGFPEYDQYDALGLAELVRKREISPAELCEEAIARIESINPRLNAVILTLFDQARAAARGPLAEGPFAGVPFLVKDLLSAYGGVPLTMGCKAYKNYVPAFDSELMRRYKAAGLIVLGKTNTPEFGNHSTAEPESQGPSRNPWDLGRTTGGSSGGSAAAVASGMVAAAHGNDGAGSIRIPSSCCGLVGLKPTRGRNSWAPDGDAMAGLAVEHALTRSVRDSAAILDATAGRVPGDPYAAPPPARPFREEAGAEPGRLRIAWTTTPPIDARVDPECAAAARATAELLESLGHHVEEAAPAFDGEVLIEPLARVWATSNLVSVRALEAERGRPVADDELEITTRELRDYALRFDPADLVDALSQLARITRQIGQFFERYDAWLTPTLARLPEPLGVLNQSQGGAVEYWRFDCQFNPWNPIANVTGQPAISLPLAWSAGGLPIGSLLTGRYADEATLYRLAGQLEAARPWAGRLPPIHASRREP